MPDWLSDDEAQQFERVCDGLALLGKLTVVDADVIACYASAFCRWTELKVLQQQVAGEGRTVITNSAGTLVPHPIFAMANAASRVMLAYWRLLYMTPAARERIKVPRTSSRDRLKVVAFEDTTTRGEGYRRHRQHTTPSRPSAARVRVVGSGMGVSTNAV
ncbi:MAG: P27 family phage terminase small subunit [Pirellulales bacterium]